MRLRAAGHDHLRAWTVSAPPDVELGALAAALGLPATADYSVDGQSVSASVPVGACGLGDGSRLEPGAATSRPCAAISTAAGGRLLAVTGPHAGASWVLGPGRHAIGRHPAMAIRLDDDDVAGFHGELEIGPHGGAVLQLRDGSAPLWLLGPTPAGAPGPQPTAELRIGASMFRLVVTQPPSVRAMPSFHAMPRVGTSEAVRATAAGRSDAAASGAPHGPALAAVVNRPPRARLPHPSDPPAEAGAPPEATRAATARTLVTMLVPSLATVGLAAAIRPEMVALALLAPLGAMVTWTVLAALDRHSLARRRRAMAQAALDHAQALAEHAATVRAHLVARHPGPQEVARRIVERDPRLWERRPRHDDFLTACPGLGADAAAPIEIDLTTPVGIVGPLERAAGVARSLLVHLAAHHGPADLQIVVWTTDPLSWQWLAWLPHVREVGGIVDEPSIGAPLASPGASPRTVLLVDAAGLPTAWRDAWREIVAPATGDPASAIVLAVDARSLPEQCRTVIDVGADEPTVHRVLDPAARHLGEPWVLDEAEAEDLAARLAPLRDPDLAADRDLPPQVGLLALLSTDGAVDVATMRNAVLDRWRRSRHDGTFAAPLGVGVSGPLHVDLVADGPHGLVAGTTGSGKSELLRALVLAFAASHDAEHLAFVLVDYKGGSAFDGLLRLPHVVDVVTDLDASGAARAVHGLEAEVLRRERALRDAGAPDIAAYHTLLRREHGALSPLPRLVIVVDEFATLASELPAFIDALVDVAQRGRSLGVHLLLATQRPSGAVKDTIRTNTNLRIALRVLDLADSRDVLGADDAAHIGRAQRGRAALRLGASELRAFQSAYAGGPAVRHVDGGVIVAPLGVTTTAAPAADAPTELEVIVDAVTQAHRSAGVVTPTRPWAEALPVDLRLDALRSHDGPGGGGDVLVLGVLDDVEAQAHRAYSWRPADGNLLVAGLAGSGTTDALLACVAATCTADPERPHVYVVASSVERYGSLTALAHVGAVIAIAEEERVTRLARLLTARLDANRRGVVSRPVLVVVDGIGTLRASFDNLAGFDTLDQFERAIVDGPAAGVHFAFGADHPSALGHRLERSATRRVLLRLADRADYAAVGARDVDPASMVPRRGIDAASGATVQIAEVGADQVEALVQRLVAEPSEVRAPRVGVLPETVHGDQLPPAHVDAAGALHLPVGIGDDELTVAGLALHAGDHATVIGAPRSGKTTLLAVLARAARDSGAIDVVVMGGPRCTLAGACVERAEIAARVDDALASDRPTVVLVDDADGVDDGGAIDHLVTQAPPHVHVIAAGRSDRLRPLFRHWTTELRRSGHAVLLRADDGDGDLVGVRLPRTRGAVPPGRGWLVRDGVVERVQCASLTAPEAGR